MWRTLWNRLGTKLLFDTVAHPQTDGQMEVVNRTLSTLLRAVIHKNLKRRENCVPHVEFAYNRAVHLTTPYSPLEIVYGFNPLAPLDILPLPANEFVDFDRKKKAEFVRELHAKVRANIEKENEHYARQANKGRVKIVFQRGDWVWAHLRKERFAAQRKSKLHPSGDGPFQVLERVNDSAYKINLPQVTMVMSALPLMFPISLCVMQVIRGRIFSRKEGMVRIIWHREFKSQSPVIHSMALEVQ